MGWFDAVEKGSGAFARLHPSWAEAWGPLAARIVRLVLIDVERALPIASPPYDDGATEAGMIDLYKAKFAELYP